MQGGHRDEKIKAETDGGRVVEGENEWRYINIGFNT